MAKLAEGTGMKLPDAASQALSNAAASANSFGQHSSFMQQNSFMQQQPVSSAPPIATQCFMLTNMFDPATETNLDWDLEVRDDVIEECSKHGAVFHIFVDKVSPTGNVYAKCASATVAAAAVNALHGRWFAGKSIYTNESLAIIASVLTAGKVITAAYVPVVNYNNLFPDAITAAQPLTARR
jgi:RNA-binding protein 39